MSEKKIKFRFVGKQTKFYAAEVCAHTLEEAREEYYKMEVSEMEHLNGNDEWDEDAAEVYDEEYCDE